MYKIIKLKGVVIMKNLKNKFTLAILSLTLIFSTSAIFFPSEIAKAENSQITMSFSNQKISISLPQNVVAEFMDYNIIKLTDKNTGESELLPTATVDMNGTYVSLSYVKTAEGLDVYVSRMTSRGFWDGVKCVAGTIGSAGLGGLGGASAGTITLPVIGSVSGTVIGAVSGGLTGVATFC